MKRVLLILLLFPVLLTAQDKFRLSDVQKGQVKKISPEVLGATLIVEQRLNKNTNTDNISDPNILSISQKYKSVGLSDKNIAKINEIICLSCYEKEWKQQQDKKAEAERIEAEKLAKKYKPIHKFNKLTQEEALQFATKIAKTAKTEWIFFRDRENEKANRYIVTFIKKELGTEKIEAIRNKTELTEPGDLLEIEFIIRYVGSNKDLEIKGTKTFVFQQVIAKYLDLFPIWKEDFRPDAELEKTLEDYDSREAFDKTNGAKFKLEKSGSIWKIYNWSS